MNQLLISILFIFLSGCANPPQELPITGELPITRNGVILKSSNESSPVMWHDEPIVIVSHRMSMPYTLGVYQLFTMNKIVEFPTSISLIAAFVDNNRLYVFGVTGNTLSYLKNNTVQMIYTDDLHAWSEPVTVYSPTDGVGVFNVSVTKNDAGLYTMSVDVGGTSVQWADIFLQSADLTHWHQVGQEYAIYPWNAAMIIRYNAEDGYYYLFYSTHTGPTNTLTPGAGSGNYYTRAARTKDFVDFQNSSISVIFPLADMSEGNNTSDMDLVESNGQTFMVYLTGTQDGTWSDLSLSVYNGTLSQMEKSLF